MSRYLILSVEYRYTPDDPEGYGHALGWIAPKLAGSELVLTEDGESEDEGGVWHRKWAGLVRDDIYDDFARDWGLEPDDSENNMGMITELGWLDSYSYDYDGMDWNAGGLTPISYVNLRVSTEVL